MMDTDEHPRAATTLADLAKLKPVFKPEGGRVTAGSLLEFVTALPLLFLLEKILAKITICPLFAGLLLGPVLAVSRLRWELDLLVLSNLF